MRKFLFFCLIFTLMLSINIFAGEKLSPALDVIATESSMVKSGIVYNGELEFDAYDFDEALGTNVKSVKITSLPSNDEGRLMLGNLYVVTNQIISREDFASLKFIPKSSKESECIFRFAPNSGTYELECVLKILDEVNYSPIATNGQAVSTWTGKNISCFGVLDGYDPDGDEIKFEIVSHPEKGLVQITNTKTGDYKYTPFANASGKDSFTYRVRDEYGNYSATTTVNIKVEKLKTTLVFSDMSGHKALNAAYEVSDVFMTCDKNADGTYIFNPEKTISTEEFLSLIMDVMGAKNIPSISSTRFADDDKINPKYKGYFESAFALGIINGERKSDGIYVNPKAEITTAEAAVIINNIIGAKAETSVTVFADEDEIPNWAKSAISSLNELGIIKKENGKINPNSPLTRAQTAQILMSLLEYRGKLNH